MVLRWDEAVRRRAAGDLGLVCSAVSGRILIQSGPVGRLYNRNLHTYMARGSAGSTFDSRVCNVAQRGDGSGGYHRRRPPR